MQKILLYYKFAPLSDPEAVKLWQKTLCDGLNLRGRILVSRHGLNGTVGGEMDDLKAYIKATKQYPTFKDTVFKWSDGSREDFPRMSVKNRRELVGFKNSDDEFDVDMDGVIGGGEHIKPHEVNYTAKTQYLFRINKGTLNESDFIRINQNMPKEDRPIPFTRMIYFGDGLTDVPCMRLVQEYGGYSIAVFQPDGEDAGKGMKRALNLQQQGRAVFTAPADYREGSHTDELVKTILNKFAAEEACIEYSKLTPLILE
jgi:hypothetical protein